MPPVTSIAIARDNDRPTSPAPSSDIPACRSQARDRASCGKMPLSLDRCSKRLRREMTAWERQRDDGTLPRQIDVRYRQGPRQNGSKRSRPFQRVMVTVQRHSCGRRRVAAPLTAYVRKQTYGLSEARQAIANATLARQTRGNEGRFSAGLDPAIAKAACVKRRNSIRNATSLDCDETLCRRRR